MLYDEKAREVRRLVRELSVTKISWKSLWKALQLTALTEQL